MLIKISGYLGEDMIRRNQLFFVCIFFILLFGFAAGCVSDNEEEFESASVLVESAEERIDVLDYENDDFGKIKSHMKAAIADLTEATLILDSIEPFDDDEEEMVIATRGLIQADVALCEVVQTDFLDFMTHMKKSSEYYESGNTAGWRFEVESGIKSLDEAKSGITGVKQVLNRINMNDLPSEVKGNLVYMKSTVDEFEILIDGYSEGLVSMDLSRHPTEYTSVPSGCQSDTYLSSPQAPSENWYTVVDETSQIQKDYYAYWEMDLEESNIVSVDISTDGAPIDLEIMDQTNFNRYKNDAYRTYDFWGSDSVIRTNYDFYVPGDDTYYIVLDNSVDPENGAYANRNVNVNVLISEYC